MKILVGDLVKLKPGSMGTVRGTLGYNLNYNLYNTVVDIEVRTNATYLLCAFPAGVMHPIGHVHCSDAAKLYASKNPGATFGWVRNSEYDLSVSEIKGYRSVPLKDG